ncbi:MAG: glycosyltransferase family 4 protein [Pseudodesulfovibrio sp.]
MLILLFNRLYSVVFMKIALVISSLGLGGAERVASHLANFWTRAENEVHILTLSGGDVEPFFDLDSAVHVAPLDLMRESSSLFDAVLNNLRRVWVLRQALAELSPDVAVSFMDATNVLTLLACVGQGTPVVVSERTDPSVHNVGFAWNALRSLAYPRALAVVVQTQGALEGLPKAARRQAVVIPNPVVPFPLDEREDLFLPRPCVMGMGRLSHEKGFDVLVDAFSLAVERYPDWTLVLLGDGPEKDNLKSQCETLGIVDKVHFAGKVGKVGEYLRQADMFVLPSRYEGFPNALCEAMACGLPVIASDCRSGPREIVEQAVNGMLVQSEQPKAMAEVLVLLMEDSALRQRLGRAAVYVSDRFSVQKILSQWDDLLIKVSND